MCHIYIGNLPLSPTVASLLTQFHLTKLPLMDNPIEIIKDTSVKYIIAHREHTLDIAFKLL